VLIPRDQHQASLSMETQYKNHQTKKEGIYNLNSFTGGKK